MEALFCSFHVGGVGVGVIGRCRGGWLGCIVMSRIWAASGQSVFRNEKKNIEIERHKTWGVGMEVVGGRSGDWLGHLVVSQTYGASGQLALRDKKKPLKSMATSCRGGCGRGRRWAWLSFCHLDVWQTCSGW